MPIVTDDERKENSSIRSWIIVALSIIILIIGGLAVLSLHLLDSIRQQAIDITEDSLPGAIYMAELESRVRASYALTIHSVGAASPTETAQARLQIRSNDRRIAELLRAYLPTAREPEDQVLFGAIVRRVPRVTAAQETLTGTQRHSAAEMAALQRDFDAAEDDLIRSIQADVEYNRRMVQAAAKEVVDDVRSSKRLLFAAVLFGILCAVLAAAILLRKILQDLNRRALADRELRRSEGQLRIIIHASNDAIWERDLATDGLTWSDRAYEVLGLTRSEFQPTIENFTALVHPDDLVLFHHAARQFLEEENPPGVRLRLRHSNGSFIPLLARAQLQRETGRLIGIFTDLSVVERAEERIREQAALLDQAHDAIIVRDLDGRITFWSKGAERLYGWPASHALERRLDELLHINRSAFETARAAALATSVWNGEVERTTASGQTVTVDSSWTLLRDDRERPQSIFSIDTDITERKNLEKQFLRTQRLESLGTLAGGIAHDLNNMLMPILMGVTLLKRLEPGERSLRAINNIELSVKRGTDLVRQVLLFARGVEGARTTLDAAAIVAEVQSIAQSTFPKNIALVVDIPEDLATVLGDATQLNQVLLNLCVNARDAMPDGGQLTIAASNREIDHQYARMHGGVSAGPYVVLEVSDSGTGISREVMERIFEPFFTTKEVGKGTGLGLSTVQGIVRSFGGFIDVSSDLGRGSSFRVYLPANSDIPVRDGDDMPEVLPRGHGELILVVDDEALVVSITRQTLEEFGYKVLTAEDGAQAIALFASDQENIVAVLTDIMMPVMDGTSLITALQRIKPSLPVIAMSGHSEPEKIAPLIREGVVRFLGKPYSAGDLLRTLFEALAQSAGDHPDQPLIAPAKNAA